jgi:hypothetical protein
MLTQDLCVTSVQGMERRKKVKLLVVIDLNI